MADLLKVLGQAVSNPNTWVPIYAVPPNKAAVVSSFIAANVSTANGAAADDFASVRVAVADAAEDFIQYLVDTMTITAGDTNAMPLMTLNAGDVVYVKSKNGQIAFNLFGSEVDQ